MTSWAAKRKLSLRRGFLEQVKSKPGPTYPGYKGALVLDKPYYKGKRLFLQAWVRKDPKHGIILDIAITRPMEAWKKLPPEVRKAREERAKKRKIAAIRFTQWQKAHRPLKEIKREDIV